MAAAGGARRSPAVPPTPPSSIGRKNPSVRCRAWHEADYVFSVADGGVMCLSLPSSEVGILSATLPYMVHVQCWYRQRNLARYDPCRMYARNPSLAPYFGLYPCLFLFAVVWALNKKCHDVVCFVPGNSKSVSLSHDPNHARKMLGLFPDVTKTLSMTSALRTYTLPRPWVCIF